MLGSAGQINSPVLAHGTLALTGAFLNVNWKYFVTILSGLGILQLIVTMFAILLANSVVVKDESRLAEARLLRRTSSFATASYPFPLLICSCRSNLCATAFVERLGPSGCILDGSDISKTLRAEVVYGVRQAGQWHHLDIGTDLEPLKWFGSFPPGWYDGEPEVDIVDYPAATEMDDGSTTAHAPPPEERSPKVKTE